MLNYLHDKKGFLDYNSVKFINSLIMHPPNLENKKTEGFPLITITTFNTLEAT